MNTIWLGIGANIGDRFSFIGAAIESLGGFLDNLKTAPYYLTAPQGYYDQPDFLNTAVRGETSLSPLELLDQIHIIETEGGRNRSDSPVNGPRTIDIDILLYEKLCRTYERDDGSQLTIPHRSMHERLFALRPLLDLDPDLEDPRDGILWKIKASHLWRQRVKLYRR